MAVALMCFGFAEFVEFVFHAICILYMMIFMKPATAVTTGTIGVQKLQKAERYKYRVNVTCRGEQAEGVLTEYVKEGYRPKCLGSEPMQVRFNGKRCYLMKPVLKSALRSFLIAAGCTSAALLLIWLTTAG